MIISIAYIYITTLIYSNISWTMYFSTYGINYTIWCNFTNTFISCICYKNISRIVNCYCFWSKKRSIYCWTTISSKFLSIPRTYNCSNYTIRTTYLTYAIMKLINYINIIIIINSKTICSV